MVRNVVQLRYAWMMLAGWLIADVAMSVFGVPWETTRTFQDRLGDTLTILFFLTVLTLYRDKASLITEKQ